ncbi:MAG: hypothetical protein RLZZ620_749 [Pseudomonadota bacterium]
MNEEKEFAFEKKLRPLPRWIFMSRWLQAPLYIGLIVAQGVSLIYRTHCCARRLCLAVLDGARALNLDDEGQRPH